MGWSNINTLGECSQVKDKSPYLLVGFYTSNQGGFVG